MAASFAVPAPNSHTCQIWSHPKINQRLSLESRDAMYSAPYLPTGSVLSDRPPLDLSSAVYPQFCRIQDRLSTFRDWPLGEYFRPDDLVMQGFYYAGYADCIRCFYCGVGLKSWAASDDVMTEHIRCRATCGYLLNIKGKNFVQGVSQRLQAEDSAAVNTGTAEPTTSESNNGGGGGGSSGGGGGIGGGGVGNDSGGDDAADQSTLEGQLLGMGFSSRDVSQAVQRLQQSGISDPDVNAVIEAILEQESGDATPNSTSTINHNSEQTQTQTQTPGIQIASGPEVTESARREAEAGQADRLRAENERMRRNRTCRQCGVREVGVIFMPCGHLAACTDCGARTSRCPLCDQTIRAMANVYLS